MKKTIFKSVGFTLSIYLVFCIINFLIPWRDEDGFIQLCILAGLALVFLPCYFFIKSGEAHPWWYMVFAFLADVLLAYGAFRLIPLFSDGWTAVGYMMLLLLLQYYFAAILIIDAITTAISALKNRKKAI